MTDSKIDLYKKYQVPEPQPYGSNLDVLIVDPQSDVRILLTHHLQKFGFNKVRVVKDGLEALVEIRRQPANIVLLSNELEGPTAHDVIQELREDITVQRDVVILCSTPINKQEVMLALENGFDDFLIKPIIPNEILPKFKSAHAVFSSPRNPERIYEYAKFTIRLKELDRAEQVYSDLAQQTLNAARPYVGLARIAHMRGDLPAAMKHALTAIQKNNKYAHAHALLGELYLEKGDLDSAYQSFREAIELSPLNVIRYEKVAEPLLAKMRIDDLISLLNIALKVGFEHPFIIERLGHCFFHKKDYAKAGKYFRQAVHAEPENISFLNALAICYRDAELYTEALDIYNQIIKKDNENHHVMFNKSLVLNLMGRPEEAIKLLRKIIDKHPDFKKAKDKLNEILIDQDS
jgi:tetratricopeptide (TPR) repeat protein